MTLRINHYLNVDPTLDELLIYVSTLGCNIECPECVIRDIPRTPVEIETKKLIETIEYSKQFYETHFQKKFKSCGIILTGGEPLMQADGCIKLISALPKEFSSVLQTNATLLTLDIADRLRHAGLGNITLTLQDEARYQQFLGDKGIRNRIIEILKQSRPAAKIVVGYWFRKIDQLENIIKDIEIHEYKKYNLAIRLMAYVTESKIITQFTDSEIAEIDRKLSEQKIPYILTLQRRNRWKFYRTYFDHRCSEVEYNLGGSRHETAL